MKIGKEVEVEDDWASGLGARRSDIVEFLNEYGIVTSDCVDEETQKVTTIYLDGDEYAKKTGRPFKRFKDVIHRTTKQDGVEKARVKPEGSVTKNDGLKFVREDLEKSDEDFANALLEQFKVAQKEYEEYLESQKTADDDTEDADEVEEDADEPSTEEDE